MKVTLVDIQRPDELFSLLDAFGGPVLCCGRTFGAIKGCRS